jgi:1-acyl-sn-glycerol-3-phosphate acyltransferase
MKIVGLENIPKEDSALLVANHSSYLDPACLGSASPRKVHFLITYRVYKKFMQTWFYRWMETIPIQGHSADLSSIRLALRKLQDGKVIGIFPEGTRAVEMQLSRWMHGVALIAARSGAPIIPVAILGSGRALGINKFMPWPLSIQVVFGKPIHFPSRRRKDIKRESLVTFSTRIFENIQNLKNEYEVKSTGASHHECRDYHHRN